MNLMLRLMAVGLVATLCFTGQAFADQDSNSIPDLAATANEAADRTSPRVSVREALRAVLQSQSLSLIAEEGKEADGTPSELSIALLDDITETSLPLEDEGEQGVVAKAGGLFKSDPWLWGGVSLLLSFLGFRGIRGGLAKASEICSPGEVFGLGFLTVGVAVLSIGTANAVGWSAVNLTMISLGFLAFLFGIGFTCQSNQERIKEQEKTA